MKENYNLFVQIRYETFLLLPQKVSFEKWVAIAKDRKFDNGQGKIINTSSITMLIT